MAGIPPSQHHPPRALRLPPTDPRGRRLPPLTGSLVPRRNAASDRTKQKVAKPPTGPRGNGRMQHPGHLCFIPSRRLPAQHHLEHQPVFRRRRGTPRRRERPETHRAEWATRHARRDTKLHSSVHADARSARRPRARPGEDFRCPPRGRGLAEPRAQTQSPSDGPPAASANGEERGAAFECKRALAPAGAGRGRGREGSLEAVPRPAPPHFPRLRAARWARRRSDASVEGRCDWRADPARVVRRKLGGAEGRGAGRASVGRFWRQHCGTADCFEPRRRVLMPDSSVPSQVPRSAAWRRGHALSGTETRLVPR